jgi:hypothetical protein
MRREDLLELKVVGATESPCGCKLTTLIFERTSVPRPDDALWAVHCRTCGAGWLEELPVRDDAWD